MAIPQIDGRRRRSERSREAIVQSMLDLVGEKVLEPTAQQIAERAGVDITTVFRHFSDMESLYRAMSDRLREVLWPLAFAGQPKVGFSLEQRISALVVRRAAFYERALPYQHAGRTQRRRSPVLQQQQRSMVRKLRVDLLRWLPELNDAGPDLIEFVDLATSFEAWDRLRNEQRLGRARAQSAIERAVVTLMQENLASETAAASHPDSV
jgi:AcrR family transcriptional regulator